ncbi:MAG TPA: HAD family hydrolase [Vicinamibacterales bacterium]|nr:HAD family hydrolase [Vicinamibacterales bacterium]
MRRAVFLDRDGTIIEELGYLTPASQLRVYPWSTDAIRLLNRAGFVVVVVTNQGGIGRGLYTREFVDATHRTLAAQFAAGGAVIDAWHYCPHHPEALSEDLRVPCECRKPGTAMARDAAAALNLDLTQSWVVGDQWRDIQLAHAIGARSVLVHSGHGEKQAASWPAEIAPPTLACDNVAAAAARILLLS